MQDENDAKPASGLVALNHWISQVGITPTTCWRWRKKGWLQTVNICGRQYIARDAIAEFERRAKAGDFATDPKVPRKDTHSV
jgi:hypothetical protein